MGQGIHQCGECAERWRRRGVAALMKGCWESLAWVALREERDSASVARSRSAGQVGCCIGASARAFAGLWHCAVSCSGPRALQRNKGVPYIRVGCLLPVHMVWCPRCVSIYPGSTAGAETLLSISGRLLAHYHRRGGSAQVVRGPVLLGATLPCYAGV